MIKKGRYRHFKGNEYQVTGVARHSENEEWLVIYYPLSEHKGSSHPDLWVRPLKMFNEKVQHKGKTVPRFEWIASS